MLHRIRTASRPGPAAADPPARLPEFPAYSDPVERFRAELESAGGHFLDGRGEEALLKALRQVLEASGVTEAYWASPGLLERHGLAFRMRDPKAFERGMCLCSVHPGLKVEPPLLLWAKPARGEALEQIGLSVGEARFGVAETGTVVEEVGPGGSRVFPLCAPAHLLLLSERNLIMNHAELFENLEKGMEGSALTLITGPSRTADIEKTLIVGVHGARQLFVILTR